VRRWGRRRKSAVNGVTLLQPGCRSAASAGAMARGRRWGAAFSTAARGTDGELRLMGKMGCDAPTFGNHEFDLGTRPEQVQRRYCQGGSHPGGATRERPHSHGDDSSM